MYEKKVGGEKKLYKSKFPGEVTGGQNNKVLEKLRNQEKEVPVNQSILIWTCARFFVAGGILWIM